MLLLIIAIIRIIWRFKYNQSLLALIQRYQDGFAPACVILSSLACLILRRAISAITLSAYRLKQTFNYHTFECYNSAQKSVAARQSLCENGRFALSLY